MWRLLRAGTRDDFVPVQLRAAKAIQQSLHSRSHPWTTCVHITTLDYVALPRSYELKSTSSQEDFLMPDLTLVK